MNAVSDPTHHRRTTPYLSNAEVRQHFTELKRTGVKSLTLAHAIEAAPLVMEILEHAKRTEITVRALHTARGEFLGDEALLAALEQLYQPRDILLTPWLPITTIVFDGPLDGPDDYEDFQTCIGERGEAIRRLQGVCDIAFKAKLRLRHADGRRLANLVEQLANSQFVQTGLEFTFPDPSEAPPEELRDQLAIFCQHPVAQHPSLHVTKLPSCFLPPAHFRPLYRTQLERIPSHVHLFRQQALFREVEGAKHRYHRPCKGCRRRASCYAFTAIEAHPEYARYLQPNKEETVAFVGASLTAEDVRKLDADDLVFTAPAEQGDAFMTVLEGFRAMVVLDGYFFQRYALTTLELLVALLENIHVFGAASLGALRTLELNKYGMRGDGYVLRFLQRQRVAPYHVVAQTYDESNRSLTEPLIAIHWFLELAAKNGVISEEDRAKCLGIAEGLHFSSLTFRQLFQAWGRSDALAPGATEQLKAFYEKRGKAAFDIKRRDALALLRSFRKQIEEDGPQYPILTALRARDTYLERLRAKYVDHHDSSLVEGWRESIGKKADVAYRERPVAETIALAEAFFKDLDVVVADTSFLDKTHYCMVSVVFVPYFFLEYGNSAGSGYGENFERALASAYCEVLERIPCGSLRTQFADRDKLSTPKVPFEKLPFYQAMTDAERRYFIDKRGRLIDRGYVECTDLMSGKKVAIPQHGARLPSSSGMAAGNSLMEATLFGLCEVLEHDVYASWQTNAMFEQLRNVNIDPAVINDPALQKLLSDLGARGHQIRFFNLINRYGIPMVLSVFYEADRQLLFTGIACRLDLGEAMAHAFHEALNGHYVSYFGSRDDRRGFEQTSGTPLRFFQHFMGPFKSMPVESVRSATLAEDLDVVLDRLRKNGIKRVLVVDVSPREEHRLSAVRVIVPEMYPRQGTRRPPDFYRRCVQTHQLVTKLTAGDPLPKWRPADLPRLFALPLKRFFKA